MRSLLFSVLLGLSLIACSKQSKTTTPPPAAAPAPAPAETPPQGIAVGEPHPADPNAAPGPRPASITDADLALAERVIGAMVKLSTGVAKAGSDCQAVATEIRAVAPEIKSLAGEGQKMDERLAKDPSAKDWFEKTYGPRVSDSMGKMMNSPCMNDPAVGEAMQSLSF
jgi:hypothetical protein